MGNIVTKLNYYLDKFCVKYKKKDAKTSFRRKMDNIIFKLKNYNTMNVDNIINEEYYIDNDIDNDISKLEYEINIDDTNKLEFETNDKKEYKTNEECKTNVPNEEYETNVPNEEYETNVTNEEYEIDNKEEIKKEYEIKIEDDINEKEYKIDKTNDKTEYEIKIEDDINELYRTEEISNEKDIIELNVTSDLINDKQLFLDKLNKILQDKMKKYLNNPENDFYNINDKNDIVDGDFVIID